MEDDATPVEVDGARLAVAAKAADIGLWDWDLVTGALVWDRRSREMFGLAGTELTGMIGDIDQSVHPDDREPLARLLEEVIAAAGALDVEFRVVRPDDGATHLLYARGQVLTDAAGRGVRMIGTNLDVTASRRAERQVAADAERLGALVAVAEQLGSARDETGVLTIVDATLRSSMGAAGTVLCLDDATLGTAGRGGGGTDDDATSIRALTTEFFDRGVRAQVARMPRDTPLPMVDAAVTGAAHFLADRDAALALFPTAAALYAESGVHGSAAVPLRTGDAVTGSLAAAWSGARSWRPADRDFLTALAALVGQSLERIVARRAERRARREAERAGDVARRVAAQQEALVAIARALADTSTESEVLAVVAGRGTDLLGAQGGSLCLLTRPGVAGGEAGGARGGGADGVDAVRVLTTEHYPSAVRARLALLPLETPIPLVRAAVSGGSMAFRDRASAARDFPAVAELWAAADVEACAVVPLRARGTALGSLSLVFSAPREWSADDLALAEAFAALTAQSLERIRASAAEDEANRAVARLAETLQRSLLTAPPEAERLEVAVRYSPAAAEAYVGGDWYDAFVDRAGLTSVVIGDVTGHDRHAAAAMGQVRNVLRGIAHTLVEPPSAILSALDLALADLEIETTASVVLAQIEGCDSPGSEAARALRWSSAGHLPPLLLGADGRAVLLEADADLLLGVSAQVPRHDHDQVLEPGSTLLLFTDGLVERRGASLTEGLRWLVATVEDLAATGLDLEPLCDALLGQLPERAEDDVAILAVRAHRDDAATAPGAGRPRADGGRTGVPQQGAPQTDGVRTGPVGPGRSGGPVSSSR